MLLILTEKLNSILNLLGDLFLGPFAGLQTLGLILFSLLAGVLLLWVYGKVSMQSRIKKVKRGIMASLLESVLFRHDIRSTLAAQGKMFLGGARYLGLAVPPLLILIIPCILLLAQLNRYFGLDSLPLKSPVLVRAYAAHEDALFSLGLQAKGEGISVSKPVRDSSNLEMLWRVTPKHSGDQALELSLGSEALPLEIKSGKVQAPIWSVATRSSLEQLLFPDGPKLPQEVQSLSIEYPQKEYSLFGLRMHWVLWFFVLSLCSGLLASRYLKVEI
jgi:hypothetical protein